MRHHSIALLTVHLRQEQLRVGNQVVVLYESRGFSLRLLLLLYGS